MKKNEKQGETIRSGLTRAGPYRWIIIKLGNSLWRTLLKGGREAAGAGREGRLEVAAQALLDAQAEEVHAERLGEVAVRAEVEAAHRAVAGFPGAQHEDGGTRPVADLEAGADAVEGGHLDVLDDEVRRLGGGEGAEPRTGGGGGGGVGG